MRTAAVVVGFLAATGLAAAGEVLARGGTGGTSLGLKSAPKAAPPAPARQPLPAVRFTAGPTATRVGDEVKISFAVSEPTDVEVAILDAKGKVVRHLAAGVLGENAPPPFRKASLTQALVWDGRDDLGKPVGPPRKPISGFKARVALGLGLKAQKVFGGRVPPAVRAMGVRPGGEVYLLGVMSNLHSGDGSPTCQVLDRQGKYLRTIIPWPGELPPEKTAGFGAIKIQRQGQIPFVHHGENRSLYPYLREPDRGYAVVTKDGKLIFADGDAEKGGYVSPGPVHVMRIERDGGCPPEGFLGPRLAPKATAMPALALSPDEKTLYCTGIEGRGVVYSLPTDGREAREFVKNLNDPRGVSVDGKGNVFVSERGRDRIVAYKPDGTLLGEVAVEKPDGIAVHRKTGRVYALVGEHSSRLIKIAGLEDGTVLASVQFRVGAGARRRAGRRPVLALDWEAEPAVVWVASLCGYSGWQLKRLEDAGDRFVDGGEMAPEGFAPHISDMAYDAAGDALYLRAGGLVLMEGKTGKRSPVKFPYPRGSRTGAALSCGADGHLYLEFAGNTERLVPERGVHRYTTGLKPAPFASGTNQIHIPEGSLHILARGVHVNIHGDGVVLGETRSTGLRHGLYHVLSFGADGKVTSDRLISGLPAGGTCSVRIDNAGNVYVADCSKPYGHVVRPEFKRQVPEAKRLPSGRLNWYPAMFGSIIKFPPTGGRIGKGDGQKVTICYGGDSTSMTRSGEKGPVTVEFGGTSTLVGALWMREAVSLVPASRAYGGAYYCVCEQIRFDVDGFGRVFAPDTVRFQVAVLDTDGNSIGRFGTYGNADSQAAGGAALRFAWPTMVAAGDRVIYVGDRLSGTILRALITYAAEEVCEIR